jgi:hypothetical protein
MDSIETAERLLRGHDPKAAFRSLLAHSVFDRLFSGLPSSGNTVAILEDAHLIDVHHGTHYHGQSALQHTGSMGVGGMMALGGSSSSLTGGNRNSTYQSLQQHILVDCTEDSWLPDVVFFARRFASSRMSLLNNMEGSLTLQGIVTSTQCSLLMQSTER